MPTRRTKRADGRYTVNLTVEHSDGTRSLTRFPGHLF
ncbi:hypothetical protein SAMN05421756_103407 [Microlunatus flavus]|uniref:Uncharacterized protein n=1 Tax=Microlunatus flavus TaxID=1036181 RepID=A0A1H9FW99_9ACTN|nr:hypothetical protein SAMN05421756_103407 [Microlunatus flavus]